MENYYAAIDLGASSGRIVIGYMKDNKINLKEIYRFDNIQKRIDNHDCWDLEMLEREILKGLRACKEQGYIPKTIGIDTWGVDFVALDKEGKKLGEAIAYRDDRTKGIMDETDNMPFEKIYERAGIQKLQFNSLYQFIALKRQNPEIYENAETFLMIADYLSYKLCGIKCVEYTNSSTTSMLNANTCKWDDEIFSAFNLDKSKFLEPQMPGEIIGTTLPEVSSYIGYESQIVLVATHDTGSAYLSVPAINKNSVFLSSGTWSLLGCEILEPNTSEAARTANFTNEGGYERRYRFLKNIMGLWMIQSVRRELNGVNYVEGNNKKRTNLNNYLNDIQKNEYSFVDLINEAKNTKDFYSIIDVNADRFLSPKNMCLEVIQACKDKNLEYPKTVGELMQCIYLSLVQCYKNEINSLENVLNIKYDSINIVGGGCQDNYLNQLTANACNIPVYAGPIEGTSIGNLGIQMINDGFFSSLNDLRQCIYNSFNIKEFKPE